MIGLSGAHQLRLHAAAQLARAQPREGDAVAVVGVHVGLDLEHEGGHGAFMRVDRALVGHLRARRRREAGERVEQVLDAEILQGRAEKHRRQMALAERVEIEAPAGVLHQRQFLGDRLGVEHGIFRGQRGQIERLRRGGLAVLAQQPHLAGGEIVGAGEVAAAPDRPGHRRGVERQRLLDLVEQLERVAALAVHLVDEGDDRDVAQPADLEQLAGARLDALGGVDHHHGAVDRGERAVGVLGEVLVARRVEQIEHAAVVVEGHHRGDHRNAALALDRHPVGAGGAAVALGLDLAGEIDGAAEQQQLLGQRGLAGVRVGNDGKGAPALHLGRQRR